MTEPTTPSDKTYSAVIVDDSMAMRETVALFLAPTALSVAGKAGTGKEGIELCSQVRPDVVFLDIVLPDMSGLEVLKVIRAAQPAPKVFMLTSISERNTVMQSKQLGAFRYLLKPLDWEELKTQVARVCEELKKERAQ